MSVVPRPLGALSWLRKRFCGVSFLALVVCILAPLYPNDLQSRVSEGQSPQPLVQWVENQGRFANTALQVLLPLAMRDVEGLRRLVWIAVLGTASTHGLKHALNDVEISGIRLGQRPSSQSSKHNMPSGHSSLASSGAVFVCRRYGWRWGLLLWPMVLAVMYTRMALDAHTLGAVVMGSALGVLFTWRLSARKA
jgi:lipid A 1-phosphatase